MSEVDIPFVGREDLLDKIQSSIEINQLLSNSIIIRGQSGYGKTTLLRKAIYKYINDTDYTVLYLNLNSDILSCSSFFEILLFTVWNPVGPNTDRMLRIEDKQSFQSFLTRRTWRKEAAKKFYQTIIKSISSIPEYGSFVSTFLKEINIKKPINNTSIDMADHITKYFKFLSKTKRIIIAIDNYQFLQQNLKVLFESCLDRIEKKLTFISIYRENGQAIPSPVCYKGSFTDVFLPKFLKDDIKKIFEEIYVNSKLPIQDIVDDCYLKTDGNLKEVELYIKENHLNIKQGLISIKATRSLKQVLSLMSDLQKYLLLISAMFPAGLKIEYVSKILNNVMLLRDQDLLISEIQKLVTLGYLVVNSSTHDLLKPAHERITLSLSDVADEDSFLEFYESMKNSLEQLIEIKRHDKDYVYILHCVIGLYRSEQLLSKMSYLIELINIEYNQCAYYYISNIYKQIKQIAENLPDICIREMLDSFQKTSEFSLGLELLHKLKSKVPSIYNKYKLFEVKYLTQLYNFDAALQELGEATSNEELLYKLNILQHMGRDSEAQLEVIKLVNSEIKDKWYYVILRNTAHYFSYEQANKNLHITLKYFQTSGTHFEEATVYNNLGVIDLWNGNYSNARNNLNKASEIHLRIQSNEIFEVYCNLGVLEYMEGNILSALDFTKKAQESVPQSLSLDHIILRINEFIFRCALKEISLKEAYDHFKSLYFSNLINKDPWVKFQVVYNLYQLELALELPCTELPNEYYLQKNTIIKYTCFEILTTMYHNNLSISLCLSPNWRY
jgi:hypothetical protein